MKYKFTKKDIEKSHNIIRDKYKKGELKIWNKNKTKKDDKRIAKQGHKERKGKTYEEIYGKEKGKEQREIRKGKNSHWYGKDRSGEKSPSWQGGITPINFKIRNSEEYKLWRLAVFERDNYTCIWCGKRGCKLNVDHIKPFALFPELRFAIDNGRTLCEECHKTTGTFKGKSKNWREE